MTAKQAFVMALISAASLLGGCHGTANIAGVVVQSGGAGPVATPIAAANVTVRCPNRSAEGLSATSDEHGFFRFLVEERFDRRCKVDVAQPGSAPASFVLGDVCGKGGAEDPAEYCPLNTVVVVRLEPATAAMSPPPAQQ